ncbi:hypothetical protein BJ944DRAFT_252335 [Cunninghamella echinulata]|nr:hypothetical protein BJ944DRAFT_252335 [Cunninghamella echinulata]
MEFSNRFTPDEPAFWRVCDEQKCHCDFRMTISHCEESQALLIVNILDIIWSIIATIIACSILYHRLYHRNQQIFDYSGRIPRPKPIESMGLFGIFFNIFRLIHASILISDVAKNSLLRSFMFEFPWQFGITALTCYLFGVVHTLANSSKAIYMSWVKSQVFVDIAWIAIVVLPFLTINPISITAGYHAQEGNIEKAIIWTETIYYLWLVYTLVLGTMVLLAGLRLLSLLQKHLLAKSNQHHPRENTEKMKNGALKVKIIIGIGCFCLWAFSIMIAIYATSRHIIMLDAHFSVTLAALALFNGPLATSLIEISLLTDFKVFRGLSTLSFGTMNTSSHEFQDSHPYSITTMSQDVNSIESTIKILGKEKKQLSTPSPFYTETNQHNHFIDNNNRKYPSMDDISISSYTIVKNLSQDPLSPPPVPQSPQSLHSPTTLEQDQLHYNAMTNQLRLPPSSYHASDTYRSTHHYRKHENDTNESSNSVLFHSDIH